MISNDGIVTALLTAQQGIDQVTFSAMPASRVTKEKLIIFTRFPQPGSTKTRLIPALGARGAAELQKRLAEYTFRQCAALASRRNVAVEVRYDGGSEREVRNWIAATMHCAPQIQGGLGDRLAHCISTGFAEGRKQVIVIGTDCPALTPEILSLGFEQLRKYELVLGPAHDGGCYLIGFNQPILFPWADIDWGTERVLRQFLGIAKNRRLGYYLLPPLADVDRPEDLYDLAALPDFSDPP